MTPKTFKPKAAAAVPSTFKPKAAEPSALEATGRGALQGATGGLSDEAGGMFQLGLQALSNKMPKGSLEWAGIDNRYEQDPGEVYLAARNEDRSANKAAEKAHPALYGGAELASGVAASSLLPGGLVAQGATFGGLNTFGHSETEDLGQLGLETAGGTLLGAAASKIGQKGAEKFGKLGNWMKGKAAKATTDQVAKEAAAKAEQVAAAQGAMGSKAADVMRSREILEKYADKVAPELKDEAMTALSGEGSTARLSAAYKNYLGRLRQGVDDFASKEGELAAAQSIDPAMEAAGKMTMGSAVKTQVVPRIKTIASRAVPSYLASLAGNEIGGEEGRWIGGIAGLGAATVLGNPGTAISNMVKSPAFRGLAAKGGEAAAKGLGKLAEYGVGRAAPVEMTDDDKFQNLAEFLRRGRQ